MSHDVARGSSAARNAGIAVATGDWLFFLDDDDLIHPRHLEELLREALAAPPDCLVSGRYRDFAIVSGDVVLAPVVCAAIDRPDAEALIELVDPESQRTITHSTILWPRKLFDTLKWDEDLAFNEDYDLFGRVILSGKHIVGREVGLYCVRMHSAARHDRQDLAPQARARALLAEVVGAAAGAPGIPGVRRRDAQRLDGIAHRLIRAGGGRRRHAAAAGRLQGVGRTALLPDASAAALAEAPGRPGRPRSRRLQLAPYGSSSQSSPAAPHGRRLCIELPCRRDRGRQGGRSFLIRTYG